jgi:hypothetical protein
MLAGVGALVVAICTVVMLDLRAKLGRSKRWTWKSPGAIGLAAALWVIPVVPAATVIAATQPLPEAHVCALDGGYGKPGVLIGESDDEVFLGENLSRNAEKAGREPRVVTFPLGRVEEVFIGPDAVGADCDVPDSTRVGQAEPTQPVPMPVPSGEEP